MFFNKSKKPRQSCLSTLIQAIIILAITIFFVYNGLPSDYFRKPWPIIRQKECFSNIRILTRATEMYNMSESTKITEINDSTYNILIEKKYLKAIPILPEKKCQYLSEGDISKDGYIYCKYHGDLEGRKECDFNKEYDSKKLDSEQKTKLIKILVLSVAPSLLFILVNII